MKLLINICGHDGIVSHYNGVGTMVQRYIYSIDKLLLDKHIEYEINLFTPRYNNDSFGFNKNVMLKHQMMKNVKIHMVENGSNGEVNYGTRENWTCLCKNTANIINKIDYQKYDKVITIYNDTPFACLSNYLNTTDNHYKILILHSTIKIHLVDSAIENSDLLYEFRLEWEKNAIDYINQDKNSYYGYIGNYIFEHLIKEYGLNKEKGIKVFNGVILNHDNNKNDYSKECKKIFEEIKDKDKIIISYGRAEEYKNLDKAFKLGKIMNTVPVVIAQLYYKNQPIQYDYIESAKENNGILYIDPPFDLAKYILNNFKGDIICLIPSKKEIMGLIVNEVRLLKKDNILIVSNNIDGLKEQINDTVDGLLVDLDNLEETKNKINKYFNEKEMTRLRKNSIKTIEKKYNIIKNMEQFLNFFIGGK